MKSGKSDAQSSTGLAAAFTAGRAFQNRFECGFLVDDLLRELTHKTATDIFIDHRTWSMGMTDMAVGRMMMPMPVRMLM